MVWNRKLEHPCLKWPNRKLENYRACDYHFSASVYVTDLVRIFAPSLSRFPPLSGLAPFWRSSVLSLSGWDDHPMLTWPRPLAAERSLYNGWRVRTSSLRDRSQDESIRYETVQDSYFGELRFQRVIDRVLRTGSKVLKGEGFSAIDLLDLRYPESRAWCPLEEDSTRSW